MALDVADDCLEESRVGWLVYVAGCGLRDPRAHKEPS